MITMLEGRETCLGATGRNGGHVKPNVYHSYKRDSDMYGQRNAEALAQFEANHIEAITQLVSEENIQCDWNVTRACDVYIDPEEAAQAKASYLQRCAHGGDIADIREISSADLFSTTRVKNVLYAITFTAGRLHPYCKL